MICFPAPLCENCGILPWFWGRFRDEMQIPTNTLRGFSWGGANTQSSVDHRDQEEGSAGDTLVGHKLQWIGINVINPAWSIEAYMYVDIVMCYVTTKQLPPSLLWKKRDNAMLLSRVKRDRGKWFETNVLQHRELWRKSEHQDWFLRKPKTFGGAIEL